MQFAIQINNRKIFTLYTIATLLNSLTLKEESILVSNLIQLNATNRVQTNKISFP